MIRPVRTSDSDSLAKIYNHYIASTIITFEEESIDADEMQQRIAETEAANLPWLVAEQEGQIAGYAYASGWKGRCAYRFSVEATVYLSPDHTGQGLGSNLYSALFALLKESGYHVVIGGIALPNPSSVALHEKFGMKKVAHFEEVGRKFDRWVDVGYWQVELNK